MPAQSRSALAPPDPTAAVSAASVERAKKSVEE
jgi:hypothetical protein